MKLKFARKEKKNCVGIRLTDEELAQVKEIAKVNGASLGETCAVLIRAALRAALRGTRRGIKKCGKSKQ